MNLSMKILLSILFVFDKGDIFATRLPEFISMEYDFTKTLDICVANMFNGVDSDSVWNVLQINGMKNYKLDEFGYKPDFKSENIKTKVHFRDITFFVTNCMMPKIDWNFSENKMHISVEKLFFNVKADLHVTKNESYSIHAQMNLLNASINITASAKTPPKIQLSLTQDSYSMLHGKLQEYFWTANGEKNETSISEDKKRTLNMILLEALPMMLIKHLNRHQIFDTIYKHYYWSKNQIILNYPDFPNNEPQFYYFIPRISFYCFYFKLIMIKGLSNFERVQVRSTCYPFTHTLLIKNVEGRMDLDYGTREEKPLELVFKIDYLTISINKKTNCVNVNAKYYHVNRTSGPLNYRQSPVVMQGIESAIATSLMPSMKVEKICDVQMLNQQIQVTHTSDWKKMKEMYKEWIPFNDENTPTNF